MTAERLRDTRLAILKRQAMHAKAIELSALWEGTSFPSVRIRCDETHKGGRRPKLAEAAIVEGHLLFMSKIEWMPSDQLNLRPWQRDAFEGHAMSEVTRNYAMNDDQFLTDMIDQNDQFEAGVAARGERWLIKSPPFWVLTAVPLSEINEPPATGLWVRCPEHSSDPEKCDPLRLIEATR